MTGETMAERAVRAAASVRLADGSESAVCRDARGPFVVAGRDRLALVADGVTVWALGPGRALRVVWARAADESLVWADMESSARSFEAAADPGIQAAADAAETAAAETARQTLAYGRALAAAVTDGRRRADAAARLDSALWALGARP